MSRWIPFIVLTPQISKTILAECHSAGADQVIKMPLNVTELLSGVTRLIHSVPGSAKASERGTPLRATPLSSVQLPYLDLETLDMLTRLSEREDFFEELLYNFLDVIYA
ncbi:MAG: hypothetical protein P8101_02270 [Candidatus Thiodiazotropha sp.]